MTILPITSLFAAVFAIALVALSLPITLQRVKVGTLMGDGADTTLHQRIRAQGNFIEYVPLGIIALALVEAQAVPAWMVVAIGTSLAFGRVLHAIGMLNASAPLRGLGMILTYLALISAAARLFIDAGSWWASTS